jgi:hypothetical protein
MAGERRPGITQLSTQVNPPGEAPVDTVKPLVMSKPAVWRASQNVQTQQGAAGVDAASRTDVEGHLKDHLEKIGNRMSSGSSLPLPVSAVGIPKKNGGGKNTRDADGGGQDRPAGGRRVSGALRGTPVPSGLRWISTRQIGPPGHGGHPPAVLAVRLGGGIRPPTAL